MQDKEIQELIEKIKKYANDVDVSLVEKAYYFGKKAHDGQFRKSGEPYFIHPVAVANILCDMELDIETIIAGLLHDVVEDTEYTYEDIEREFSKEIADLVDGVTKLGQIKYQSKEETQAENLRKMFLAMAKDIRVILIKLADRLHNMRTLKYMPPTKFMTGNIFRGHIQDALFNMIGIWTSQGIQLLGMPTEAIHTPFMSDRYLSIENAKYIFGNMKNIGDEVEFKKDGIIQNRAKEVLNNAIALLENIEREGLFTALEKGIFGDVKRPKNGGKGLDGVAAKGANYYNPFIELMLNNN